MPAPYSDNLYSEAEENRSDAGADDALSPADGYFRASSAFDDASASPVSPRTSSNVPFVPNVLVQDPTLQQQQASVAQDKAQEAERERMLNTAQGHTQPSTTSSPLPQSSSTPSTLPFPLAGPSESAQNYQHRRSVEQDAAHSTSLYPQLPIGDRRPLLQHDADAPPAYTPTSPTTAPTSYQTFPPSNTVSTMGNPEEQPFLPNNTQYPGQPPEGYKPPLWMRLQERGKSSKFRKFIKTVLGILVIISIILALTGVNVDWGTRRRAPPAFGNDPVKPPPMDNPDFEWRPTTGCLNTKPNARVFGWDLDFDLDKTIHIGQEIERNHGRQIGPNPRVSGEIVVRPAGKDGSARVEVAMFSNENVFSSDVSFYNNGGDQELKVITPRWVTWSDSNDGPCIQIHITVYVPNESVLRQLRLSSVQLDVAFADGLVLGLGDSATVETVSGDITTSSKEKNTNPHEIASRKIQISTVSGDVRGWFPLYDLLQVETASGDVRLDVSPKEASKDHVESAKLTIETVSGDIYVKEEGIDEAAQSNVPLRDYVVRLHSASGEIRSSIFIGSSTSLETISGDMSARVVPVLDKKWTTESSRPRLDTDSKSGDVRLEIAEPILSSLPKAKANKEEVVDDAITDASDDKTLKGLTNFRTVHNTISGTVQLRFPASWEGVLTAEGMSSNLRVRGKGVSVTRKGGFVGKELRATKGTGNSVTKIGSLSGDVDVLIGSQ